MRKGKGKGKAKGNNFSLAAWPATDTQRSMEENFAAAPATRPTTTHSSALAPYTPHFAGPMAGTTSWYIGDEDDESEQDDSSRSSFLLVDLLDRRALSGEIAQLSSFTQPSEQTFTATWANPLPSHRRAAPHLAWWQDDNDHEHP